MSEALANHSYTKLLLLNLLLSMSREIDEECLNVFLPVIYHIRITCPFYKNLIKCILHRRVIWGKEIKGNKLCYKINKTGYNVQHREYG